ncbi:hypothetical protein LCGC14_0826990 [marine sediment metagenome]|uniref:Uncharacterized protein n=1 Tax=marine sediment metagenome TaxID=412755 RepID=A0A0F9PH07_9ZZZZ
MEYGSFVGGDLMTNQEEIREGMQLILSRWYSNQINRIFTQQVEDELLEYLHSQGVVLKVADTSQDTMGFYHPDIVAVEPLIMEA